MMIKQARSGELNVIAYMESLCDEIESREPGIQAFVPGTFDRDRVLREAETLVAKYPDPSCRPPLFGLPVGVKDIFRAAGFPTRCGSLLPPLLFQGTEASSVTRLRQAGAIIMGKTVTTECAGPEPGPTRNPRNLAHSPGGSSSGSAAGVAAGYFPVALGTQTGGSITRPAAYCGIIGMKPSFGRIPTDGVIPFSPSADHVGVFFADTGLMHEVMPVLVEEWEIPTGGIPPYPVLGVPEGPYLEQATRDALIHFEEVSRRLEGSGLTIRRIPLLHHIATINKNHRRMITGEITRIHAEWFQEYPERYRPRTKDYFDKGKEISDGELAELRAKRLAFRESIHGEMRDHGVDCWVCPSASGTAPQGLSHTGDPVMNLPWSNSGLPTISLPSGFDRSGLPYGLQLVGRFGEDECLLGIAERVEASLV